MTAELLIRDAVPGDAPALTRLNAVAMGYDYPEDRTRRKLEKLLESGRDKILVAEREGQVVGYLHLVDYDVLYADHMKNIMGIAVDPGCRRQGIGRALLEAGETWAKEQDADGIRLVSGESRKGAHAFYRALGYEGNKMQLNLKKTF
ncbi:GNAT family N-acetyltransferase [Acutalibacter sp. 1XD8-33]|uniref:GNAT family N-acetyltransferase n=1 Tax=Acutalibacter sp. 1XD8-33 TaxID=2320081 RepID=UPI0018F53932|nr:GNAT family N-acetyltransferase [Acutalibacter sp. 1XD8-33]